MGSGIHFIFLGIFSLFGALLVRSDEIQLRMPNVRPQNDDAYLCHSVKMDNGSSSYITNFIPHGDMAIAHHMLIYGCSEPGSKAPVWNCGEMAQSEVKYDTSGPCSTGTTIIYAWAMDAPGLNLPKGVAFKVGHDTNVRYLVVQVHYKDTTKFRNSKTATDNSGITIKTQNTPTPKVAGIYLLGTGGGGIPAHSTVFMDALCKYTGRSVLHPFAFRTHTHKLGKVVSGFRIRDNKWTEIGRKSPQKPQMFYNTTEANLLIEPGDSLAARCVMTNSGDKTIGIGATQADEMCNFYMMYWVYAKDSSQLTDEANQNCFSHGWPNYQWKNDISNIPDAASIIPGTTEILKEDNQFEDMMDERSVEEGMDEDWVPPKFPVDGLPGFSNPYDFNDGEENEFDNEVDERFPEEEDDEEDLMRLRNGQVF